MPAAPLAARKAATRRPARRPFRCQWQSGVVSPTHSAVDTCRAPATAWVVVDGVPIGCVCPRHAAESIARFWQLAPIAAA